MSKVIIGQLVKDFRLKMGLTQEELADASGLAIRSIQRIENGKTIPRGDSLKRISSVLNVSIEELIDISQRRNESLQPSHREDHAVSMILVLSAFGYLLFPLLGVILPLVIWHFFRRSISGVQELGTKLVRLELLWCVVLALVYLYLFVKKILFVNLPVPENSKTFTVLVVSLYIINAIAIVSVLVKCLLSKRKTELV